MGLWDYAKKALGALNIDVRHKLVLPHAYTKVKHVSHSPILNGLGSLAGMVSQAIPFVGTFEISPYTPTHLPFLLSQANSIAYAVSLNADDFTIGLSSIRLFLLFKEYSATVPLKAPRVLSH